MDFPLPGAGKQTDYRTVMGKTVFSRSFIRPGDGKGTAVPVGAVEQRRRRASGGRRGAVPPEPAGNPRVVDGIVGVFFG